MSSLTLKRFISNTPRVFGGSHSHIKAPQLHPEKFLQVAREYEFKFIKISYKYRWPKEAFYSGNMVPLDHVENVDTTPNLGHATDHPNGEDTHHYKTTLSNPFTSGVLMAGVVGYILYRINHYVSEGQEVHPLTSWLDKQMNAVWESPGEDFGTDIVPMIQKKANDRLILLERRHIKDPFRLKNTEIFTRASDRNLQPCDVRDFSDVKFRHSWELEDHLTPEKVLK